MPWRGPEYEGEFPTLGWQVGDWIEAHCVVPDRGAPGDRPPYRLTNEMWAFLARHYRLREDARASTWETAWFYTRSMLVRPQKWGKSPFIAALICAEAVAPVLFDGWNADGEPVGRAWPTPIIQVTASTEDQTDNVYKALRPMIDEGPLADLIPDTGETRINLPGGGWIEPVTSKALSRLGARITFAPQDEPGTWKGGSQLELVADTQYRGLAGTGGRAILITNGWDLAENSVAQQLSEGAEPDVHIDHVKAPEHLKYTVKADRAKIHRHVYGDSAVRLDADGNRLSGWVNLDRIESDASKLMKTRPEQAMRFFGNLTPTGSGAWMPDGAWDDRRVSRERPAGGYVCLGIDGSNANDWTGIRLETMDFHQFTPVDQTGRPMIWNPAEQPDGRIPRSEVMAALEHVFTTYDVVRAYFDPPFWQTEISLLQGRFGDEVVIEWPTYRPKPMHAALERLRDDVTAPPGRFSHDGDVPTGLHVRNAVTRAAAGDTYILGKPSEHQKIDLAMSSTLAHEAASDAIAAGWTEPTPSEAIFFRF